LKNREKDKMKILVLGVNGFIGNALVRRIVTTKDWEVCGMDLYHKKLDQILDHPRFHFLEDDIAINKEWIDYHIRKCDVAPKQLLDRVIWAYG
jgi:nucleoside-diphosphate-sugar epimerase